MAKHCLPTAAATLVVLLLLTGGACDDALRGVSRVWRSGGDYVQPGVEITGRVCEVEVVQCPGEPNPVTYFQTPVERELIETILRDGTPAERELIETLRQDGLLD
jgi:hypothetical protein